VVFYGITALSITAAGLAAGAGYVFLAGMAIACAQLTWQIYTLDVGDPANCLRRFRTNRDFGAIVFLALVAEAGSRAFG
jgi:4-hydroxybenzoate polyprenyltransferase